jgi:hypothetical protein
MGMTVGEIYQVYTKQETIAGEKVRVIGTLAYSETAKIPYNMTILAINERVIAIKDEDLEAKLAGETIYHLRATTQKADGSYAEYIVWDSILNKDKTLKINKVYQYKLECSVLDVMTSPITQVISDIERFIQSNYPALKFSITATEATQNETLEGVSLDTEENEIDDFEDKISRATAVLEALNRLENKLIPAAETIIQTDITQKLSDIIDDINSIKANTQIIANSIG